MADKGSSSVSCRWLNILLKEKFFSPCSHHASDKKKDNNYFCLECCATLCTHCLPLHHPHRLLQIRRYMYHDVLRLGDAQNLLNCTHVQPYKTNRSKVLFLKRRAVARPVRGSGDLCVTCNRVLQENYLYCSLSCMVEKQTAKRNGDKIPQRGNESESESEGADDSVRGSVLISQLMNSSGSTLTKTPSKFVKKRRRGSISVTSCTGSGSRRHCIRRRLMNRRKQTAPRRSPLY